MERTDYLDGIRGVAALVVIAGHCSNAGFNVIPWLDLTWTAKSGVWLFFILSAYLLGSKLVNQLASAHQPLSVVAAYGVRRILRIVPLYAVFLLVMMLIGGMSPAIALRHLLLLEGQGLTWTIPVEMKFYLLLPVIAFLAALIPAERRFYLGAALCILGLITFSETSPPYGLNSISLNPHFYFFAVGLLVIWLKPSASEAANIALCGFGVALSIVTHPVALMKIAGISFDAARELYPISAMGFGIAFVAVNGSARLQRIFSFPPLRAVGLVSFSLYLFHHGIVGVIGASALPGFLKAPTVLLTSFAVATLTYWTVERPFLRLGGRWAEVIQHRRVTPANPA